MFPFHLKFTILAESSILKNLLIHCDRTCHSDVVILTQTLFFYIIINKHWLYWIPASNLLTSSSFSLHCADNSLILASMSRISPSSTSGNWPCNEFNAYKIHCRTNTQRTYVCCICPTVIQIHEREILWGLSDCR